jgi:SpoVK/Ycf46/Vps4 family AAA+-type ATPase
MSRPGESYRRFSATDWVFWHMGHALGNFRRGVRDSAIWRWRTAREDVSNQTVRPTGKTHRPILILFLIAAPIAVIAVLGPPQWLINWPVMLAASLLLVQVLRGPLAEAPSFLRKTIKIAVSFCLLMALTKLMYWTPVWGMLAPPGADSSRTRAWIMVTSVLGWFVVVLWIVFSRSKGRRTVGGLTTSGSVREASSGDLSRVSKAPQIRFSDVGGLEALKGQIRQLVQVQLEPSRYKRYGVVRNGILLYGPRGSGKTFLAKATAGEFRLNYYYLSPTTLITTWVGETERALRNAFAEAAAQRPVVFFIDELDSLGTGRQVLAGAGDPGGGGRSYNSIAIELMQSVDRYRGLPGFILMAATNLLDTLDEALIRPGRFDLRLRVDLPDEATRVNIFEVQLSKKPWSRFDLQEFARKTPGVSAARIRALVDQAAAFAADEGRNIEARDLGRALEEAGGRDRPLVQPVQWEDIVLDERVERDLRTIIQLLNDPGRAEKMGLDIPTGLMLVGPPGTGKSMIARLIATQTRRSFYPITAADVLGGLTGESVKRVSEVFTRAKEHSPSIIFLDEMDGLLPGNNRYVGQQHDVQVVDQFMIEISDLQPEHNILLVGTTNHVENIDSRVQRGGRFSEKIEIGVPGPESLRRLLEKYLAGAQLEPGLSLKDVAEHLSGLAPADLEAISRTAKRFAFNRAGQGDQLPALNLSDFKLATERVRGAT